MMIDFGLQIELLCNLLDIMNQAWVCCIQNTISSFKITNHKKYSLWKKQVIRDKVS